MRSSILDKEPVSRAITALLEADDAVDEDFIANGAVSSSTSAIRVIDAFLIPKFRYDPIKKQFHEYVIFFYFHFCCSVCNFGILVIIFILINYILCSAIDPMDYISGFSC